MSDEPTDPRLRLAISDPGATTPRLPNENVTDWSARAVLASDWYAERIAQARREGAAEALRETAADVLSGAPVGNERYTGVQIERYLNARALTAERA